jgi:hypothetical protein
MSNRHTPQLDSIQKWMQAAITHQAGLETGADSEASQSGLDSAFDNLEEVITPSLTLSGAERLDIYTRSYHARLLQCFQAMFPALLHALGADLFNHFALDYLQAHPPSSYTLDQLADGFSQHLTETRPDADAPPDKRESWPDFIIDLATLEWEFLKVYDGPGVEGLRLTCGQDIRAMSDEPILDAQLRLVPCLRLFAFSYPVRDYLLAARRAEMPELPAPSENFVAMTRLNYRVVMYDLTSTEYKILQALKSQHTTGEALPDSPPLSLATVKDLLCDWAEKGFILNVEIS